MISQAFSPIGVAHCIELASETIGADYGIPKWAGETDYQNRFMEECFPGLVEQLVRCPELRSLVSLDNEEVNSFLLDAGFEKIRLDPSKEAFAIYIASIIDNLLNWSMAGTVEKIGDYDAFRLRRGILSFVRTPGFSEPTIKAQTLQGDTIVITPHASASAGPLSLMSTAHMGYSAIDLVDGLKGAVIPMVNFDQENDISWLQGIYETTNPLGPYIEKAVQQSKFRMNDKGARDKSATAMTIGFSGCCLNPKERVDYVVDRPFVLSIHRGSPVPLFVGHFFQDSWENPGEL